MLVVQLQNSAIFSIHEMIASLLGIFTLVTQQPFEVFSLGMFHILVELSAGACPIFVASMECKIGLVDHLAVERRCDDMTVVPWIA